MISGSDSIGKFLVLAGLILVLMGALFLLLGRIPLLGKLPGDILLHKRGWSFYFPLTTSILVSIILSIVLTLLLSLWQRR